MSDKNDEVCSLSSTDVCGLTVGVTRDGAGGCRKSPKMPQNPTRQVHVLLAHFPFETKLGFVFTGIIALTFARQYK